MTIEIANRFLDLRKAHNLSQEELAERLGVSRQAVSKWERGEASPDTDNLIALAKIYGISLDELIFGEKQAEDESSEDQVEEPIEKAERDTTNIKIGPTEIFVESEDGDKVKIDLSGIKIASSASEFLNEIKINSSEIFDDDDDDDDDDDIVCEPDANSKGNFWKAVPYPVICSVLYLLFGFYNICGGWALSWIIFVTVPIYYSLIDVISKKRLTNFAYPVFCAFAYLYIGLYHGNWHPSWLVFITIPIYYPIAKAIDKAIKNKENASKCK